MDELKRTIALLFKRKGRSQMSEKEFVFSASMDMRWFPPKDSQKLLDIAIARGAVSVKKGQIIPNFEVSGIEIPLDFTPSAAILEMPPKEDLFAKLLDHLLSHLEVERKDAISRINAIQAKMEVEIEVAAILAGEEHGLDMSGFLDEVEKEIVDRLKSGS
ncbi:MAG: DUF2240 family protein [Methanobacteriota archaeon]|nr:MAG: DUF2240 family protein [Euryarchaeota archaeon]